MPLFLDGKRSIFDLKVKDEAGRWYIIEMQRKMERDYINRVQFYGSYSYVNQIEQGVSHKDLLPVVVISIIGQKVFDDELPCINYHCLKETNTNKQYLFSLMYVFVELGKFDSNKIENDIDQWLHLLKCAHNEQEPPKAIKNSIKAPATANELTSIPISVKILFPKNKNKIMITPAIREAFSLCICPTFLRKSITIGILPTISITANNTIKTVKISLKFNCITNRFKFFAKVWH